MLEALVPVPQIARGDSLTDQAEAALRQALMSGGLAPGETLTIRALSSMLGVSVTPAKDAINRLVAERVIEWGPRRTARVPILTHDRIDEIYAIRIALEGVAAAAAAPGFDNEGILELQSLHASLMAAFSRRDYRSVLASNRDFHFAIYRRAGLPMMLDIIEGLWLRMGPTLNLLYSNYSKRDWADRAGVGFHDEIILALRSGDADAVRAQVTADLETGRSALKAVDVGMDVRPRGSGRGGAGDVLPSY